jgi:hypothetical protein
MKRIALLPLCLVVVALACNNTVPNTPTSPIFAPEPTAQSNTNVQTAIDTYLVPYAQNEPALEFLVPSTWKRTKQDSVVSFDNPNNNQVLQLYTTSGSQAKNAQEQLLTELGLNRNGSAESFELANGETGWLSKGGNWWMLTATHNIQAYHLLFTGEDGREPETATVIRQSFRVGDESEQSADRSNSIYYSSGETETLDPAQTHSGGGSVIGDLFTGLVILDPSLQVRPALAERWEASADGKTYTFYLRQNARFHNGRPITAADVVASWERAASPELGSSTVMLYMNDILGLPEFHNGTTDQITGLKQLDDFTLQVQLSDAKPYFLAKLTYPGIVGG